MLMKSDEPSQWEDDQQLTSQTIVTTFTMAPVLRHFDHERDVIIGTDVSDYISADLVSQYDNEEGLHLVA